MRSGLQKKIKQKLMSLVEAQAAPGFQLSLGLKDKSLGNFVVGFRDVENKRPLHSDTFMDLSSLTKVIATVSLLMHAYQKNLLKDLGAPIKSFFPFLTSELKNRSILDLLHHRAGLSPIFTETDEIEGGREERKRFFIEKVDASYSSVDYGREIYSDVGFMILGMLIETIFSKDLKRVFEDFYPRDDGLCFGPLDFKTDAWSWLFSVPTVAKCLSLTEPRRYLSGRVQDPRAAWFFGQAGHSGLFGNSEAVENWAREIYLSYHGKALRLGDKSVRQFIHFEGEHGRFVGGFDTPSKSRDLISQAGYHASSRCIGHLGYTGCSFWMDLEKGYRVSLLSHRHQLNSDSEKLKELRPSFHDWLYEEVFFRIQE